MCSVQRLVFVRDLLNSIAAPELTCRTWRNLTILQDNAEVTIRVMALWHKVLRNHNI